MAEDVLLSESRGACVVFVALVFFNFIRTTSPSQTTVKCLRCGEMGAAGVWHAKQPYREHHYISYSWLSDDSNDDIHFIISITKQLLLKLSRVIGHF